MRQRLPFDPQLWLCSPAIRAYSTASLMQAGPIALVETLYPGSVEAILRAVAALDERLDRVALVGHNPALAELASHLAGNTVTLRTAEMAWLRWDGGWPALKTGARVTPVTRPD